MSTLFAQFIFAEAKNKKVDRYIPIEEIRQALNKGLADKCDVNAVIDAYLAKETEQTAIRVPEGGMNKDDLKTACEQDASEVFNQIMDKKIETLNNLLL